MKKNLLSIGEVSKATGVHISSLRYYEKLGVLKPAYTDPATGYRCYTYSQIEIVNAIQTCIALDIPLKEYQKFTGDHGQTIHAEELLEYGKAQAKKKMQAIREGIRKIEQYQQQIERSKQLLTAVEPLVYQAPKKTYFVQPMRHSLSENDYPAIDRFPLLAEKLGYQPENEYGLLYFYSPEGIQRYQFVEVALTKKASDTSIITLSAGSFYAKATAPEKIEDAVAEFPELFRQNGTRTVLLTGLFTEDIEVNRLCYELRCYAR